MICGSLNQIYDTYVVSLQGQEEAGCLAWYTMNKCFIYM